MPKFLKEVESSISTRRETSSTVSLTNSEFLYTLADRTATTDKQANLFSSFNLPYSSTALLSGSTTAKAFPELFQLNVDKIVVVAISRNDYSEFINGRSITFVVPQYGGTGKTVVSTLYSQSDVNVKMGNNAMVGENVSFLFSDAINKPFTGTTGGGAVNKNALTSWDPSTSFRDRPSAVSYQDLQSTDINTDTRAWNSVNKAVNINEEYPTTLNKGYNYDIPAGICYLDRGYLILTHPDIVNNIPWTSGSTCHVNGSGTIIIDGPNYGPTSATTNIAFTATTTPVSSLSFQNIDVAYKTSAVCLGLPREFYLSTNPSWDLDRNYSEVTNQTFNLDSIYVTQIGLYNIEGDLIAVAKLDRPVEKTYDNILTFNLEIDV